MPAQNAPKLSNACVVSIAAAEILQKDARIKSHLMSATSLSTTAVNAVFVLNASNTTALSILALTHKSSFCTTSLQFNDLLREIYRFRSLVTAMNERMLLVLCDSVQLYGNEQQIQAAQALLIFRY